MTTPNDAAVDVLQEAINFIASRVTERSQLLADMCQTRDAIRELVEAAEAELIEVERRDRIGAIRPEERGTIERLRAALRRFATGGENSGR